MSEDLNAHAASDEGGGELVLALDEIVERFAELPVLDRSAEEIVGYDEAGLPT